MTTCTARILVLISVTSSLVVKVLRVAADSFYDAAKLRQAGHLHYRQGDLVGAELKYRQSLRLSPSGRAYSSLGMVAQQMGNLEDAIVNYVSAIGLEPTLVGARINIGSLLEVNGKWHEALGHLRFACKLDPGMGEVHADIGSLEARLGDAFAGEQSYITATKLDPTLARAHKDLGLLRKMRGDLAGAEQDFRTALGLEPVESNATEIRKWLGVLSAARGAFEESEMFFREAAGLRLDAGFSPVSLVMNFEQIGGENGYLTALREEKLSFKRACSQTHAHDISTLQAVLRAVRALENNVAWIVDWYWECLAVFGIGGDGAAYGAIWFQAWQSIIHEGAMVQPSFQLSNVLIVGSGLGEQCLFAIVLGASHCIGYDLLCKSMVAYGQKLFGTHNLSASIQLSCGDAPEASILSIISFIWVNNFGWDEHASITFLGKLVPNLKEDTILVSFQRLVYDRDSFSLPVEDLQLLREVTVKPVSWAASVDAYIYKTPAPVPRLDEL